MFSFQLGVELFSRMMTKRLSTLTTLTVCIIKVYSVYIPKWIAQCFDGDDMSSVCLTDCTMPLDVEKITPTAT